MSTIRIRPKWVLIGGCCLAFLSAAVNAVFLLKIGASVAHLTGDVSQAGVSYVRTITHTPTDQTSSSQASQHARPRITPLMLVTALVGFITGAAGAGYFIHHPTIEISRPYGRSISVIGGSLLIAHYAFVPIPILAIFCASFACGLQNALATRFRGIVLRTTHVTGLLTDLGSNIGMKLKGHHIPFWKIVVPLILVMSFFAGTCFGAILVFNLNAYPLLVLAGLYLGGGMGWTLYKHLWLVRNKQDDFLA